MSGISLTASMRSNLLSLQNISGQVSSTQNKLSTGNKVNSAIDNPSSYYTALSLNNRADDLNALLDSMGQAVSTIKAATTALESATEFLEQAKAVANQALEQAIPSKEQLQNMVGENGAVVSTAQELKDAIAAGKETICVYGSIDYFENERIDLADGQKLVGTEYFTGYTGKEKFSKLNFSGNLTKVIYIENSSAQISDLEININSTSATFSRGFDILNSTVKLNNLSINHQSPDIVLGTPQASVYAANSQVSVSGYLEINKENSIGNTIFLSGGSLDIEKGATAVLEGAGVAIWSGAFNVYGELGISTSQALGVGIPGSHGGGEFNVFSGAYVKISSLQSVFQLHANAVPNAMNFEAGCFLDLSDETGNTCLQSSGCFLDSTKIAGNIRGTVLAKEDGMEEWEGVREEKEETASSSEDTVASYNEQYWGILTQYNSLIKDASYKGINLLQNDKLAVKFNEDNTASLSVQGKDMSSQALGLKTHEWKTQEDVTASLTEMTDALQSIRNYSSELGNNYSIITTRQDFTESLINVLTEGADKLTLADMNEESANMLALQTRQQLAINSLSLASQASQSILKLF